ncbi:diguanylate cyclase [Paenibacillus sp. SAF-054]|uniref:diguanylate cyclase n=1 Tax=unclassified Paenibacillus TaxID=185978 RepID=UPI003F7E0259
MSQIKTSFLSIRDAGSDSQLIVQPAACRYFSFHRITERIQQWRRIPAQDFLRIPVACEVNEEQLVIQLPGLPEDWMSFPDLLQENWTEEDRVRIFVSFCLALGELHRHEFVYGFVVPGLIHVHKVTKQICLDVQPFYSTYPFVNFLLKEFPYDDLSWHSRFDPMPRLSDLEAAAIMLDTLFGTSGLPERLVPIRDRLKSHPESLLYLESVASEAGALYQQSLPAVKHPSPSASPFWLHPDVAPVTVHHHKTLRSFFRQGDDFHIAVMMKDPQLRTRILRQHTLANLESHLYVMIQCTEPPLSTLREGIERLIQDIQSYYPGAADSFLPLSSQFEYLLDHYFSGGDMLDSLADWLMGLMNRILALSTEEHLFFIFENCHLIDEGSLEVFTHFIEKYGQEMPKLHVVYSGEEMPEGLKTRTITRIELMPADRRHYEWTMRSLLGEGEVSGSAAEQAAEALMSQQIHPMYGRTMLLQWISTGRLQLGPRGWTSSSLSSPPSLLPAAWAGSRIQQLSTGDLHLLCVLSHLPGAIRFHSIAAANGLSIDEILPQLLRLSTEEGLIDFYHDERLFVPEHVRAALALWVPESLLQASVQEAFQWYRTWQPRAFSTLLAMATAMKDETAEYYYLILFYRKNRSVLMIEQAKELLERIVQLQYALKRKPAVYWLRKQITIYQLTGDWESAEQTAKTIYDLTGQDSDRFLLWHSQLFQNKLDLELRKPELFAYLTDERNGLHNRAYAFYVLIVLWVMVNLEQDEKQLLHEWYVKVLFPNRRLLHRELYLQISTHYAQFLLEFFPDQEEWALTLLGSLEVLIEHTGKYLMKLRVHTAYMFHRDMRTARNSILKLIEGAKRLGIHKLVGISQSNGAELALYMGDIRAFWYHHERTGKLERIDWSAHSIEYMLLYSVEWKDWDRYSQIASTIDLNQVNAICKAHWEVTSRYADFLRHRPVAEPEPPTGDHQEFYFMKALHAASRQEDAEAMTWWEASILAEGNSLNGIRMMTGWSYREYIRCLLIHRPDEADQWLEAFHRHITEYGYYLFLPDYYYFSSVRAIQNGDDEESIVLMNRAVKSYRLQGKESEAQRLLVRIQELLTPSYLEESDSLLQEPKVQLLLQDRKRFLLKTLNFALHLRLSEQLPETMDIEQALEKFVQLLMGFFPVEDVVIDCQLRLKQSKQFYTASGVIHPSMLKEYRSDPDSVTVQTELYHLAPWKISVEAKLQRMDPESWKLLDSFMHMIKPHISASVLIREMMIDNLTRLYVRDYFMKHLELEFKLSTKSGLDLSVIMIDLDNFRRINEYGHQEGDRVLKEVADLIQSMMGPYAVPGRYGGEEFLVVLPKTDGISALRMAEKIRLSIHKIVSAGKPFEVTASLGVSSISFSNAKTPEELVRLADEAEIRAKKTGKNKVVASWNPRD